MLQDRDLLDLMQLAQTIAGRARYAHCHTNPACTRAVASFQEFHVDQDLKLLVKMMFETVKWELCVYKRAINMETLYQHESQMGIRQELDNCVMLSVSACGSLCVA